MGRNLARVVQVGFNKCATRSLAALFAGSGHRAAHHKLRAPFRRGRNIALIMRANMAAGRKVFAGFDDYVFYADLMFISRSECYEAFKDYRRILADYPGTILLLNTRDRENWIRSRSRHGHGTFLEMAMAAGGFATPEACREHWRRDWEHHIAGLRAFMADRPGQLVEFDSDTENVEALVARLPDYRLDPAAWGNVGRSRGRHLGRLGAWVHLMNAKRRMKT